MTIALAADALNARAYDEGIIYGNADINIGQGNYDNTGTAAANFIIAGNNITCTLAGTYEVVITKADGAWKIKINTVV